MAKSIKKSESDEEDYEDDFDDDFEPYETSNEEKDVKSKNSRYQAESNLRESVDVTQN